jgi:hypothetical protein
MVTQSESTVAGNSGRIARCCRRQKLVCLRGFLALAVSVVGSQCQARADAVVTDGRFTNVYVYPDPSQETWDQHLKNLPANMKPSDWQRFTIESIDAFTQTLMNPAWPSFFGALHQYGGINPPRFFGSYVASQQCVDAALKDANNGVIEATTIRSLSNCHQTGMDPSPQVNLIFSPDMKVGEPPALPTGAANGPDICSESGKHTVAYHWWGLNTPNFVVLPTAPGCARTFAQFTSSFSHEVVELLSDPGQFAHGGVGGAELADQCKGDDIDWNGINVQRYRSDNDDTCWPLKFPSGSSTTTWVLAEGSPKIRFSGDVHELTLKVPERRLVTDARTTGIQIWIQTGGDDLRGGNDDSDNADVTLTFLGGSTLTGNINNGREWGNGQTHIAWLTLPATTLNYSPECQKIVNNIEGLNHQHQVLASQLAEGKMPDKAFQASQIKDLNAQIAQQTKLLADCVKEHPFVPSSLQPAPRVQDIQSITIMTRFGGGTGGDNWNVDKVALKVGFPKGSKTWEPPATIVREWLNRSGGPLVRFSGDLHDHWESVPAQDIGEEIRALDLIISTGNDDLRGGSDNCDVLVELNGKPPIKLKNVNAGKSWTNWSNHSVAIPLPPGGLKGGDVKSLNLHTEFGGEIGGDNWNVQRIQLKATLK